MCIYVYVYIYIYISMHVCMYACIPIYIYILEVGGVSQVSPDAQPGHRFVSFVRAGEARRGEAA